MKDPPLMEATTWEHFFLFFSLINRYLFQNGYSMVLKAQNQYFSRALFFWGYPFPNEALTFSRTLLTNSRVVIQNINHQERPGKSPIRVMG